MNEEHPVLELIPHDASLQALAAQIDAEHQQALSALRSGLEHARRAGDLLLEARGRCPHGRFLPWLKANVKCAPRTAQAYMRVAKRWGELQAKAQGLAHLTFEGGLKLLAGRRGADSRVATEPSELPMPALQPGKVYECLGRTKDGRPALLELSESTKHPGFTNVGYYHSLRSDFDTLDYQRRPVRLGGLLTLAGIIGFYGFVPDSAIWLEAEQTGDPWYMRPGAFEEKPKGDC